MNNIYKFITVGLVGCVCAAICGWAQEINVTASGVEIGAAGSAISGALIQQSGQDTSFITKDGGVSSTRIVIKGDGKVGIGTTTPSEILTVGGNATVAGNVTAGGITVGSSPILTVGSFESAELSIPGGGSTLTVPHGLGGQPRFVTVSLRCKTAENGWAVNDEILLNSVLVASSNNGFTVGVNNTNIKYVQKGTISTHWFSNATWDPVTTANWRLVFRAWR